jgi:hypothetical protein
MRTIAMAAALVQELLLYTFDGSLLQLECHHSILSNQKHRYPCEARV